MTASGLEVSVTGFGDQLEERNGSGELANGYRDGDRQLELGPVHDIPVVLPPVVLAVWSQQQPVLAVGVGRSA